MSTVGNKGPGADLYPCGPLGSHAKVEIFFRALLARFEAVFAKLAAVLLINDQQAIQNFQERVGERSFSGFLSRMPTHAPRGRYPAIS